MLKDIFDLQIALAGYVKSSKQGKIQCKLTSLFMNAYFTEKRIFFPWHYLLHARTHNTGNGGNGNNGPASNNQQGDDASPGKFTYSKAT